MNGDPRVAIREERADGVTMIGGRPYRLGFHHAFWVQAPDAERLRAARRENVLSSTGDVYHYTSLPGLQGIISTSGFWASDNRFMNDAEEMRHGARLTAKVLEYCTKRARLAEFSAILDLVRAEIVSPSRATLVACFSTARDSLEQWRAYGQSGGVCLKLGPNKENELPFFFGPDQLPIQVVYDWRRKVVLLLSIIRRFEKEYIIDKCTMGQHWPENHDKEYASHLSLILSSRIVAFKDESFRQESEIRIVIPYGVDTLNDKFEGGLRFRVSALGLIPYVCTGDRKGIVGRLPIRELVVGPSARQELIAESVNSFMEHNGYPGVPITLSKVPYRS
jgi:hypothetical protein